MARFGKLERLQTRKIGIVHTNYHLSIRRGAGRCRSAWNVPALAKIVWTGLGRSFGDADLELDVGEMSRRRVAWVVFATDRSERAR